MADISGFGNEKAIGVPFLVSAAFVLGSVAAYCSSPQTAEINIKSRADTLMKWVNVGALQSALFIGIAAICDKQHRPAILAGGGLELLLMYMAYLHAKQSGLANGGKGTES
jgi:hypothetical protein